MMRLFFSGDPTNKSSNTDAIYTLRDRYPSSLMWRPSLEVSAQELGEFCEHLYSITMERNGLCYFYPDESKGFTICRFEWHRKWKKDPFFLRMGLVFKATENGVENPEGYLATHKAYEKLDIENEKPNNDDPHFSMSRTSFRRIKKEVDEIVVHAKLRIGGKRKNSYRAISYIEADHHFFPTKSYLSAINSYLVTPTREKEGKRFYPLIVDVQSHSYFEALRRGDERVNFICAIFSLSSARRSSPVEPLSSVDGLPVLAEATLERINDVHQQTKIFEGASTINIETAEWVSDSFELVDALMTASNKLKPKEKNKFTEMIMAYYSALSLFGRHRTLSIVSLIAAVGATLDPAKNCCGEVTCTVCGTRPSHPLGGERDSLLASVVEIFDLKNNPEEIEKAKRWTQRIYREHRSSYVHAAKIRFNEYSQSVGSAPYSAGLPNAIPNSDKLVNKQQQMIRDSDIALVVARVLILNWLGKKTETKFQSDFLGLDLVDFTCKPESEGYIGMPNNGWVRL